MLKRKRKREGKQTLLVQGWGTYIAYETDQVGALKVTKFSRGNTVSNKQFRLEPACAMTRANTIIG